MRFFVVQVFSFSRTMCGLLSHLDVFIIVSFVKSTRKAIVAEANLLCGDFLFEKNVVTLLAVFFFFLVLTTRHYLSFHNFERQWCLFGFDDAFIIC